MAAGRSIESIQFNEGVEYNKKAIKVIHEMFNSLYWMQLTCFSGSVFTPMELAHAANQYSDDKFDDARKTQITYILDEISEKGLFSLFVNTLDTIIELFSADICSSSSQEEKYEWLGGYEYVKSIIVFMSLVSSKAKDDNNLTGQKAHASKFIEHAMRAVGLLSTKASVLRS